MIFPDATATTGRTPLLELARLAKGLPGRVLAKLEMRNPCGSVKDRVGVAFIPEVQTVTSQAGADLASLGLRQSSLQSACKRAVGITDAGLKRKACASLIPEVLNLSILDEVIAVTDQDAFAAARRLARTEGIVAGVSSGAALHAALAIAARPASAGQTIVTLLADTGERYITSPLFDLGS